MEFKKKHRVSLFEEIIRILDDYECLNLDKDSVRSINVTSMGELDLKYSLRSKTHLDMSDIFFKPGNVDKDDIRINEHLVRNEDYRYFTDYLTDFYKYIVSLIHRIDENNEDRKCDEGFNNKFSFDISLLDERNSMEDEYVLDTNFVDFFGDIYEFDCENYDNINENCRLTLSIRSENLNVYCCVYSVRNGIPIKSEIISLEFKNKRRVVFESLNNENIPFVNLRDNCLTTTEALVTNVILMFARSYLY